MVEKVARWIVTTAFDDKNDGTRLGILFNKPDDKDSIMSDTDKGHTKKNWLQTQSPSTSALFLVLLPCLSNLFAVQRW